MKNTLFLSFILLQGLLILVSCEPKQPKATETAPAQQQSAPYNQYLDSKITVEVYKVDSIESNGSRGWGYDIMIDGKLYIHQPNIPSIMGNNGFSSEEFAREAGEFAVSKMRKNIIPPSVTPEELDSLGVL